MANGSHKGSSYEREICRLLSEWWTKGTEGKARQDVFWRSSQSGGRATQRAKFGKTTFGSYGDIAAVDPVGRPLLKLFTIELKRGRSHGCPNDLLDCRHTNKPKPFEQAIEQARAAQGLAKSKYWMLISRRDGRQSMVFFPSAARHELPGVMDWPVTVFCLTLCSGRKTKFLGMRLEDFLQRARPQDVIKAVDVL